MMECKSCGAEMTLLLTSGKLKFRCPKCHAWSIEGEGFIPSKRIKGVAK